MNMHLAQFDWRSWDPPEFFEDLEEEQQEQEEDRRLQLHDLKD